MKKLMILITCMVLSSCSDKPKITPKSGECYKATEFTSYMELIIDRDYTKSYISINSSGEVFDVPIARFNIYPKTRLVECPAELFFRKKVVETFLRQGDFIYIQEQIINNSKFNVLLEK